MFISYDGMMISPNRVMYRYCGELHLEGGLTVGGYNEDRAEEQDLEDYEVEKRIGAMAGFVTFDNGEGLEFFNAEYVAGYKITGRPGDGFYDRDQLMVSMTDGEELDIYDDDVAPVLRALGHPE